MTVDVESWNVFPDRISPSDPSGRRLIRTLEIVVLRIGLNVRDTIVPSILRARIPSSLGVAYTGNVRSSTDNFLRLAARRGF
ncbi:hypothetical protein ATCV1_z189R [Acanthocystis turfacea chlorella virus 1]|uniref:Uncharacterized protein z189R n=1 Tax=Chlorovirus heliozoae TaxID=322019 RepID=A7K8E9_9PHYC|nr:hypothetical protein ATCV1_z189R [Acanthocystis turfacea chlorella virus 1]ABT16323.1 hypothetical protein ATCV1_z189R [Acanthocystis turfacea chlorella virus 1]